MYRLDALSALAELFFGDTSLLYKGLDDLIFACRKNKTLLRRKFCLDKMFIPKLLYSVNDRVNQWLTQCSQQDSVMDTSLELVEFSNIITKLQLNKFSCFLPPNIKKIYQGYIGKETRISWIKDQCRFRGQQQQR